MSTKTLQELLNSDKNPITINKNLLKILDIEEAVLYSFLVAEYLKDIQNNNFKCFNEKLYIYCSVEDTQELLNMSPFKQRTILNKLQDKGLLSIKLGQSRARYISINENPEALEEIMFGPNLVKFEKEFKKYIIKQIDLFKEEKNIDVDNRYFLHYFIPSEKSYSTKRTVWAEKDFDSINRCWISHMPAKKSSKTKVEV